ncbi:MAG: DNA repair protein RecO [Ginsengibacter sp.]
MIYHTNGIVLKTIKYGETSVVVNIFTALFGIQSYLVNGVRTSGKSGKAHFFQPTSMLELEVYHNELKNLQRIKECKWSYLYRNLWQDVIKNSVALYMTELLQKGLKQPETNSDLFSFCEDAFVQLDCANETVTANYPLYFCLNLAQFFGLKLEDTFSPRRPILDLQDGTFIEQPPPHPYFLEMNNSFCISQLLKARHPNDLDQIRLNKTIRKELLSSLQTYYSLHIQDFGALKTLPVLHELLS